MTGMSCSPCSKSAQCGEADVAGSPRVVAEVPQTDYDRTVVFCRELDAVRPINCPASQPVKPRNGIGAVSAEITKAMPKPSSKILGAGSGQIIAMIGKRSMASMTPMPCPASKTLETIVQARENNKIFGSDIATTENHIADRAEPKFGRRRQAKYKAQFCSRGICQMSSEVYRCWPFAGGERIGPAAASGLQQQPLRQRRDAPEINETSGPLPRLY